MQDRTCECCGWTFQTPPKRGRGRSYCDFCLPLADRHRHYRTGRGLHPLRTDVAYRDCVHCGAKFACSASDSRRVKCGLEECDKNLWRSRYTPASYGKTCTICGEGFRARRPEAKYCSDLCRERGKRLIPGYRERQRRAMAKWVAGLRRTCDWCGHEFTPGSPETRLCSRECVAGEFWRDKSCPAFKPSKPQRRCRWCDHPIDAGKFCSSAHADAWYRANVLGRDSTPVQYRTCAGCGESRAARATLTLGRLCGRCQEKASRSRNKALRRGAQRNGEVFTLREIAERDGWKCHLCGDHVEDVEYDYRPSDPTLDHLIPVSEGGTHTRDNVRLAHMICNSRRSVGGSVQLMLIG